MSIPASAPVPAVVREIANGRPTTAIWCNDVGGLTFEVGDEIVKWHVGDRWDIDLAAEAERLAWAAAYASVPEVIAHGRRSNEQWMQTRKINAQSAVHPSNDRDPATTVRALGQGLRWWHDTLPVGDCPYRWDVASRLAARPCASTRTDSSATPSYFLARAQAMERDMVVCHGDACSPNFLVRDGKTVAYVDLGSLGVGDRWADLSPALRSLTWNFGEGWEQTFLDAYRIEHDQARFDFYSALWDLA